MTLSRTVARFPSAIFITVVAAVIVAIFVKPFCGTIPVTALILGGIARAYNKPVVCVIIIAITVVSRAWPITLVTVH